MTQPRPLVDDLARATQRVQEQQRADPGNLTALAHLRADERRARQALNDWAAGDTPLRNGQTTEELAAGEREHFGDPDKRIGIYAPGVEGKTK